MLLSKYLRNPWKILETLICSIPRILIFKKAQWRSYLLKKTAVQDSPQEKAKERIQDIVSKGIKRIFSRKAEDKSRRFTVNALIL